MKLPQSRPTTPLGRHFSKRLSEHQFDKIPDADSQSSLVQLFNKQANRLLELGFDKHAPVNQEIFWTRIWKLKMFIKTIKPKKDCIPFLIVFPRKVFSLQKQAALLSIDCRDGSKSFNKDSFTDLPKIEIPYPPYLAVNISLGDKFRGLPPKKAIKKFNGWWRKLLPLTIEEGFALATHFPELINLRSVDLIGTRFRAEGVPGLIKNEEGLWISYRSVERGAHNRSPAFCHKRIST